VCLIGLAVLVHQAIDLVGARDFGGLRALDDGDVGQAVELLLQHRVGTQVVGKLEQRDMGHHTGEVDRGLDTGVAPADHGDALALEQRAVAVRAVGHALAAEFLLAGHVHLAPARAGGDDDGARLQRGAILHLHFGQRGAVRTARHDLGNTLQVHHVDAILLDVLFQAGHQLRAFGMLHRDEVLNRHRVHDLATEALGDDAGADALARSVDCRGCAGRSASDDEHVKGRLFRQLLRIARRGAGVDLGEDLTQLHAALAELLAVEVHRRHRHDLALFHFLLEQRAIDHRVADVGVEDRHQVQRLHHVRAVVAGQRDVGLEVELAFEVPDLLDHVRLDLRRVAGRLQQGEDQRGEFVAHRQAGKAHATIAALGADGERGLALVVVTALDQGDEAGLLGDIAQQFLHLLRLGTLVQRRHNFDWLRHALQVGFQLSLDVVVQHTISLNVAATAAKLARPRPPQTGSGAP